MNEIRSSYAIPIALCLLFIFVAGIFAFTLHLRVKSDEREDEREDERSAEDQNEAEHESSNKKE